MISLLDLVPKGDKRFPSLLLTAWFMIITWLKLMRIWTKGTDPFHYMADHPDMYAVDALVLLIFPAVALFSSIEKYWLVLAATILSELVLLDHWLSSSYVQTRDGWLLSVSALLLGASLWVQANNLRSRLLSNEAIYYWVMFLGLLLIFVIVPSGKLFWGKV